MVSDMEQKHTDPERPLGDVATHTQRGRGGDDFLDRILSFALDQAQADSGSLMLLSHEEDPPVLRIKKARGLSEEIIRTTKVPLGSGISGWVAREGKPLLLLKEVGRDERFVNVTVRSSNRVPGSAICLPLKLERGVIGVLSVNRRENLPDFTPEDLEKLSLFANALAIAIENAELREKELERMAELSRLNAELAEMNEALKSTQMQLLQQEKMASIGQLAAGVAHEINNPIGFVHSNLETLKRYLGRIADVIGRYEELEKRLAGVRAPVIREILDELADLKARYRFDRLMEDLTDLIEESRDGTDRVRKIVLDLKTFSRVDRAEREAVDLRECLRSTLNILRNEIKHKARLIEEYDDTLPKVLCYPSRINQVFMNILVNAAQAIETFGEIRIRTSRKGGNACIEISDTGPGIPQEALSRIWEPFYTTKPPGEGTGLGLSISYGIIEKHGGTIEVESEPGKGTTFVIELPIDGKDRAAVSGALPRRLFQTRGTL